MVGERGFEPPTPCSRSRCSTRLSHSPNMGCGSVSLGAAWRVCSLDDALTSVAEMREVRGRWGGVDRAGCVGLETHAPASLEAGATFKTALPKLPLWSRPQGGSVLSHPFAKSTNGWGTVHLWLLESLLLPLVAVSRRSGAGEDAFDGCALLLLEVRLGQRLARQHLVALRGVVEEDRFDGGDLLQVGGL